MVGEAVRHIGHVLTKTNDPSERTQQIAIFSMRLFVSTNFLFQILDARDSRQIYDQIDAKTT